MTQPSRLPIIPAAFFGIVLGLAGLGGAWRIGARVWTLPPAIGEGIMLLAALVWLIVAVLYAAKWIVAPDAARAEAGHPVQCCFIGLAGVATMLVGLAALPYLRIAAVILVGAGALFTLAFALWRTGLLWQGDRDPTTSTPILYLPTVAGGFVTAIAAGALGHADWGQLAFGAALLSWLAIESVLLHRLYTSPVMPAPMRPALGIQLAPPVVGAVAYLAVGPGVPDIAVHAMIGYGLLQALLLLRLLPWIRQQPFTPSYWGFTFGATALASGPMLLVEHGDKGAIAMLAPWLFAGANIVVLVVAGATLRLALKGRLLG